MESNFNQKTPNHSNPFDQSNIPLKKREKWKTNTNKTHCFTLFLHLLISILIHPLPVVSQSWDGIIVTESDFQALQSFKQELIDPNGFLKSWNDSGYGACSGRWEGIKCAQGQVIVIQLPWRGLGGRISPKIGQFQALRKLSLHDNSIGGSIPKELGFLPNLRGLQLFNNKFTGSIPPALGSCPLLQTIDLGNNSLVGTIPESLANCSKLYRVNFTYNSLTGSIPAPLTKLNSLQFLALQFNNLSGVLPDSWGNDKNGVKFMVKSLTLDHNFFSGALPVSLSKLTELQEISFSHNKFIGTLPVEFGGLSNLKSIDFSYNSITGSIPPSFSNLSSLNSLNLAHNNLTGEIPIFLGDRLNLTSFNVSYNNLSGSVPTTLSSKFDSSAFVGNLDLCGYSPSTPCPTTPPPSTTPSPPPNHGGNKLSTKEIILIAAGALIAILLLICCILLCCLFKKRGGEKRKDAEAGAVGGKEVAAPEAEVAGEAGGKLVHFEGTLGFTADDLLCATAEIMGKSTYGTVYKATLEDGDQVAVKRLREKITKNQREFEIEVNLLGKIRHPNLLAMRAYYLGPKGEKLLVFDYMPNGSLVTFLHARGPETPVDWATRMRIAKGMSRGLLSLHTHHNIIHGNLTSSNVLLDQNTNPKIADFGLSRLMTAAANSNVIATAGALGYRAPELSKLKKANTKTDVYSLGVIMLELLTGKSPGEAMNGVDLPQWVASIVKEEWTNEVFDLELMKDAGLIGDELLNTLKLALHCVDPSPSARPEVQLVLQQLEEIRPETATSSGDDGGAGPSMTE
ncbi:hypothetical protein LXL04_035108 [Taraxacum kok-saghyz]